MRGKNGQVRVTDGPYSETKEVLGGYYTIEAASYEQALDRARDCPHLEYGGTIEVRQVDEMTRGNEVTAPRRQATPHASWWTICSATARGRWSPT